MDVPVVNSKTPTPIPCQKAAVPGSASQNRMNQDVVTESRVITAKISTDAQTFRNEEKAPVTACKKADNSDAGASTVVIAASFCLDKPF